MTANNNANNGRVTMAVLGERLDNVRDQLETVIDKLDTVSGDIGTNRDEISRTDERVKSMKSDIEALQRKSNFWDSANSIGVVIAGVLAALFGTQK